MEPTDKIAGNAAGNGQKAARRAQSTAHETVDRAARGVHETVDRLADKAGSAAEKFGVQGERLSE
ncbi:MAG TPA: hypothetical protein VF267_01595, partial [Gammaproteobacteria bacterium]